MATLTVPNALPSSAEDAQAIRKAVEGWGTDERALISIFAHRDATQRKLIRQAYEQLYNEDLIKRLESELSGDFERAVYRWILNPSDRDAVLANVALKKEIVEDKVIVEIACTRSSSQLLAVKQAYHCRYKRSLEEDVASHTTGDFRKLLVALVGTYRYDGPEIDVRLAKGEAKILHNAIQDQSFNHEEVIRIISTRSKPQLNATFNSYKDEFGTFITKDLKSDPTMHSHPHCERRSGASFLLNDTWEKVVRLAIKRHGTDEDALTRVIVTRAEIDLEDIKAEYGKRNNISLEHAVAKDISGDYKAFLLALLGRVDH